MTDGHEPTIEELGNNLNPLTQAEVEPMLLLDTSGSMADLAAPGGGPRKLDVVQEAIGRIVAVLEVEDSQAEHERAEGADEAEIGGLYTIGFADHATDYEDINSANLRQKWAAIRWGGSTHICAGWEALVTQYSEEFGDMPSQDRPKLLALIITDGEAQDGDAFADILAKQGNATYVAVAIIGHGADHDRTLEQYNKIAAENSHIRVLSFDSVTSGETIAASVLALIGK
jgi:uncharacterized protein YegL